MIKKIGNFTSPVSNQLYQKNLTAEQENSSQGKNSFLDKFQTGVRNSADMTDTIVVPRTIFKGYLGIMLGTAMATLGAFINKPKAFSKGLKIGGLGLSTYGTWAFVRPFIIKDAKGVEHTKQ